MSELCPGSLKTCFAGAQADGKGCKESVEVHHTVALVIVWLHFQLTLLDTIGQLCMFAFGKTSDDAIA